MIEWKYLNSDAFFMRHILAAYYVKASPFVIELGSYRTAIAPFLTNQFCYCVDERLEVPDSANTRIIKENFPCSTELVTKQPYSVVALGMDLQMKDETPLYKLIEGAETVVLEFPPSHFPSVKQFARILDKTSKRVYTHVELNFSNNDFGNLSGSAPVMPVRKLFVLR